MVFREIGHQLERGNELIVGVVVLLLLPQHGPQGEMHRRVIRIRGYQGAKFGLSFMEFLRAGLSGGSQERSRNGCANLCRLNVPGIENSHQVFAGSRGLDLPKLAVGGQSS